MAHSTSLLPLAAIAVSIFLFQAAVMVTAARSDVSPKTKFFVQGKVFCDTCRAGFETPATTYISGAKVKVVCRTRRTGTETCSFDGITDETGTYTIPISEEHEFEKCEAILVHSPDRACDRIVMGRERAEVFLTSNNGMATEMRYANAMGFRKVTPLAFCAELMKQYEYVGF